MFIGRNSICLFSSLKSCLLLVLLSAFSLFGGCAGNESYETVTLEDAERAESHADHDHHHHHEAPHGGHLIELGNHKYNAEVLLEDKQLVIYVLDAHAENAVAIAGESIAFETEDGEPIALTPQPQEGDADGKSSRFVASGGAVETFGDIEDVHGSVKATIEGTEYTGELSHDHDHEEDADHDDHGKEGDAGGNNDE